MFDLKNDYSAILDKFDEVDVTQNSFEKNAEIFDELYDLIRIKMKEYIEHERERQKKLLYEYKKILLSLFEKVELQLSYIDDWQNNTDQGENIVSNIWDMDEKIRDYSINLEAVFLNNASSSLDKEELEVCITSYMHRTLTKYHDFFYNNKIQMRQKENDRKGDKKEYLNLIQETKDGFGDDWRIYFYLILSIKKQNSFNYQLSSMFSQKDVKSYEIEECKNRFYTVAFQEQLSRTIYYQRKKLKLTQKELSIRSGIDRTMIVKIERLSQPTTLETAIKLLTALDMGMVIYPLVCNREN